MNLFKVANSLFNRIQHDFSNDSYSIDRQKRFLSGKQIGTLKTSILCLDNKQCLDVYREIFNHGNKDNQISIGEYDLFVLQIEQ